MCGIVGAVAQRDVVDILVEGLRRLEYRGYDSAGVAAITNGKSKAEGSEHRIGPLKPAASKYGKRPT